MNITRPGRSVDWTREKITTLTTPDVRQLRVNAERLNDPEIMGLCDAVLGERPRGIARKPRKKKAPAPGGDA